MSKIQGLSTGLPDNVDLDQLEIEILIICKNPAAFQQSATFLSKRGWPTTVVGNLSKAIDIILKKPPDIILISINHQNPGSQMLPSVLGDSGQTICVSFSELSDATTAARLQASPIHFKLNGTPSGPNIHRLILRILKELYPPEDKNQNSGGAQDTSETEAAGSDLASHSSSARENHNIKISAGPETEEESIDAGGYRMARKRVRQKLREVRAKIEGWDLSESKFSTKAGQRALLDLSSEKAGRGESGMMFLPTKGDQENSESDNKLSTSMNRSIDGSQKIVGQANPNTKESSLIQTSSTKPQQGPIIQEGAPDTTAHNVVQEGKKAKSFSAVQEGPKAKQFSVVQEGPQGGSSHVTGKSQVAPDQQAAIENGLTPGQPARLPTDISAAGTPESLKPIDKAMEEVLLNLGKMRTKDLRKTEKSGLKNLGAVDLVCALPFEGEAFNGYVVIAASGIEEKKSEEFFNSFRQEFVSSLQKQGVKAKLLEGFLLSVDQFSFTEWAKNEATLAFQVQYEGIDVGVSFLATEFPVPQPEPNSKDEMAKIKLKDIDLNQPVTFKTYLYFKSSNRYFLYLRNGRKILESQRDHLLSQNVNDLYIKSVDSRNFSSYQAAIIIGRSTKAYRSRKAS